MSTSSNDHCIFILDTNVLMHDPTALFRFMEHDIFLPMIVLEELDKNKTGSSEVARNARQTSRFIGELIADATQEEIERGLSLEPITFNDTLKVNPKQNLGRLYFQTHPFRGKVQKQLPGDIPKNGILSTALTLQQTYPENLITLVSKDINRRIKAAILGIHARDYYNDQVLEDVNLLYSGVQILDKTFWEKHGEKMDSWVKADKTFYRLTGQNIGDWHPGQCLFNDADETFEAIVRSINGQEAIIETLRNYRTSQNTVWGINARNREQNFALNLLMNPEIDFLSIVGLAGTGKTLLTLAAGLTQTLENNHYKEIIMTRVTMPVGEDIGYLPGTEEEKMTPWMGALMDNLEVLIQTKSGGDWGRAATNDLLSKRIKIRSVNFMRGRTLLNRFIIIDEAQNLTSKQLKTLITRAGPGSKVVCLGNIAQIDTPYLTETTSGLTYVVDRFKTWAHSGHITLLRGERSRLADFASEAL